MAGTLVESISGDELFYPSHRYICHDLYGGLIGIAAFDSCISLKGLRAIRGSRCLRLPASAETDVRDKILTR